MAFWRRKKEDRYITLGLNEPLKPAAKDTATVEEPAARPEPPANLDATGKTAGAAASHTPINIEPTVTGSAPTPLPQERTGNDTGIGASSMDAATPARPAHALFDSHDGTVIFSVKSRRLHVCVRQV